MILLYGAWGFIPQTAWGVDNVAPPAVAPIVLNGATADTLTNLLGNNFQPPGAGNAVTADGNTTTTNNGTITPGNVVGNRAIISTANFPNNPVIVNNSATGIINARPASHAIATPTVGTLPPFNISNSGTIFGIILQSTVPAGLRHTITNSAGGVIQANGLVQDVISLQLTAIGSPLVTINNSGTISSGTLSAIQASVSTQLTLNNNAGGLITGLVLNGGAPPGPFIIFNAAGGSQLIGNFQSSSSATLNEFNVNGNYTLGGNITNIRTIQVNDGTFSITNPFAITNFTTFNSGADTTTNLASAGATVISIAGGTLNVDGDFNISAGTLQSTNTNINEGGTITTSAAGIFNGGTITIDNGGALTQGTNITGNITNSGTHTASAVSPAVPWNVVGNYIQTDEGTFSPEIISQTNYGSIDVSGNADIQGGTISVSLPQSFNNLSIGDTFDVLHAGGALTYNLNTLILPSNFTLVPEALASNIVRLRLYTFSFRTSNPVLKSIESALLQIANNPPTAGLRNLTTALLRINTQEGYDSALAQLSPNAPGSIILSTLHMNQIILDKIAYRLDKVRLEQRLTRRGYAAGDLAGDSASTGPIIYSTYLKQGDVGYLPGYTANTHGFGFVGDMPLNHFSKVGAGLGLSHFNIQPGGIFGHTGNRVTGLTIQPLVYLSLDCSPSFVDALLSGAYTRYHSTRNIPFISANANANFDGFQFTGKIRTGVVIPFCMFEFTPLAALQVTSANQGRYTESGDTAANLRVGKNNSVASQFSWGGKIAAVNTPSGFFYELHSMMLMDLQQPNLQVTSNFAEGGPSFTTQGATPKRIGLNVGASLSIFLREQILFTAGYDFEGRKSFSSNSAFVRARWVF